MSRAKRSVIFPSDTLEVACLRILCYIAMRSRRGKVTTVRQAGSQIYGSVEAARSKSAYHILRKIRSLEERGLIKRTQAHAKSGSKVTAGYVATCLVIVEEPDKITPGKNGFHFVQAEHSYPTREVERPAQELPCSTASPTIAASPSVETC